MSGDAVRALLEAAVRSIDEDRLKTELRALLGDVPGAPSRPSAGAGEGPRPGAGADPRFLLQDILDESILAAKAGEKSFPLRLLLSELATRTDDTTFTLLCALNVYFRARAEADDEAKMRLGLEVSRLYYRFMDEARPDGLAPAHVSPLVAALLSTELQRLRFEAVDQAPSFDSQVHERAPGSNAQSAAVRRAVSFLCRVPQTGNVRMKALVLT